MNHICAAKQDNHLQAPAVEQDDEYIMPVQGFQGETQNHGSALFARGWSPGKPPLRMGGGGTSSKQAIGCATLWHSRPAEDNCPLASVRIPLPHPPSPLSSSQPPHSHLAPVCRGKSRCKPLQEMLKAPILLWRYTQYEAPKTFAGGDPVTETNTNGTNYDFSQKKSKPL